MAQNPGSPWVPYQSTPKIDDRSDSLQLQKLQAVFSAFQDSGVSSSLALDLFLHQLVGEARSFLEGSSSAIALRVPGNHFVCRAAAGKFAPGLETRIEDQDGLSAECVRSGRQQICHDTESDARVDAEMCKSSGIRSLAIIPLFWQQKLVGILEVFAPLPHAFDKALVERLTNLGNRIVDTVAFADAHLKPQSPAPGRSQRPVQPWVEAKMREPGLAALAPPEPAGDVSNLAFEGASKSIPPANLATADLPGQVFLVEPPQKRGNLGLTLIALATGLVAAAGLWWWPTQPPQPSVAESRPSPPKQVLPDSQPATVVASNPVERTNSPRPSRQVAVSKAQPSSSPANQRAANEPRVRSGELVVYERGKIVYRALPGSDVLIGPVTSASETEKLRDTTDVFPSPVITGGKLIHQVLPTIPPEVVGLHLPEDVLLEGIIGQDGTVRDIRFIRGDARLSAAAIEAVRQWRYQPFRSNGEPVDMLSSLSVHFR
jgi:hypothetical protein